MVSDSVIRDRFYRFLVDNGVIEEFEDFCYEVYMDDRYELVVEKSRQVGISFTMCVRMLCDALLLDRGWVVFSESKSEASNKIGLCRLLVDRLLDLGYGVDVVSRSRDHIAFRGGGFIEALSYRNSRGRGYSGSVFIDECFWVPNIEELLSRVLPVLVRSGGVIRLCGSSSYKGHYLYSGVIDDVNWRRIYWWDSRYFCKDIELARLEAVSLSTRDRVYRFGNGNLVRIYESYGSDIDFAREFECYVGDIEGGVVSYDRLMSLVDMDLDGNYYSGLVGFAEFLEDVSGVDRSYYVGVDIGRRINHTELVFVDFDGNVLYNIDLGCISFDEQRNVLCELLDRGLAHRIVIDSSGLGMDLYESLHSRYGDRVIGLVFTSENKSLLVRHFSRLVSGGGIRFAYLRDLLKHILDLRIEVSSSGNVLYRSSNSKHNCDKFWALCLALYGYGGSSGLFYEGVSEFSVLPSYMMPYFTVIDGFRYGNRLLRRLL